MKPNDPSRLTRRNNSKTDRILNWAIGIVAVLILIVGGFLLISIKHTSSNQKSASYVPTHNDNQANGNNKPKKSTSTKTDKPSLSNINAQNSGDSQGNTTTSSDQSTSAQTGGNGSLTGPWKPIGTTQQEPHHKSYQKGSTDWNEMVKALSYATGIKVDNMTIWWLGNGGGPDLSVGRISKKGAHQNKYEVHLKWVANKGWMPTSVTVLDGSQQGNTSQSSTSN